MADQRATPLEQAGEQTTGLLLGAAERHLTVADPDRAQVDIAAPRLPGRSRCQQGCRTGAQPALGHLQIEGRLLAGPTHEDSRAEVGDRLAQAALELVTGNRPLDLLQTGLEGDG
ncbi:hypothetical protein D3C86_1551130 [compost metagenome]